MFILIMGNKLAHQYRLNNSSPQVRVTGLDIGSSKARTPISLRFPATRILHEGTIDNSDTPDINDVVNVSFHLLTSTMIKQCYLIITSKRNLMKCAIDAVLAKENFQDALYVPLGDLMCSATPHVVTLTVRIPKVDFSTKSLRIDVDVTLNDEPIPMSPLCFSEAYTLSEQKKLFNLLKSNNKDMAVKWHGSIIDCAGFEHSKIRMSGSVKIPDGMSFDQCDESSSLVREVSYKYTLSNVPMVASVTAIETQKIKWCSKRTSFCVQASTVTPKVPFGTSFTNNITYCVAAVSENACRVHVTSEVTFLRNVILKGRIKSNSEDGMSRYIKNWMLALANVSACPIDENVSPLPCDCTNGKHLEKTLLLHVFNIPINKMYEYMFSDKAVVLMEALKFSNASDIHFMNWSQTSSNASSNDSNEVLVSRTSVHDVVSSATNVNAKSWGFAMLGVIPKYLFQSNRLSSRIPGTTPDFKLKGNDCMSISLLVLLAMLAVLFAVLLNSLMIIEDMAERLIYDSQKSIKI